MCVRERESVCERERVCVCERERIKNMYILCVLIFFYVNMLVFQCTQNCVYVQFIGKPVLLQLRLMAHFRVICSGYFQAMN